ncbi:4-oxalocrotonate tautomerase [Clostridium saccharoperbutylacetonicum]|uniref:4-oxalocrotonate tautomerase-like protein n=1 Tax=Clostridium saccharoperbutylacetonicum N1-4(HMT) TaxID=931276 RepID=M1ML88_9CLOT|nr:4-oxalocrotonate tautomerase DmpI [Clostridium saccharoperbutylacetonicum]AGF55561.1 4-oxalocrotonate tautomerase-like protein [Clostridium saccharoperbutylacetonicum N1-4(HMT)]NRT63718.1 4-oxalocrotonate tautomerase [Clostridium saccharoperbutylacetonicum]NSB27081.1 4-oxalocrotonate tautomerase [Clostridium saccharoperbutylacetonicum]NSB40566.1 4-oxalocrotonate tautomerase [Clostridium saccharoperbutylacetonicum]
MPVITVEAGKLNKEQKSELVKELTGIASRLMKVPEQAFIVLLKENEQDNIGFCGQLLSERK